MIRTSRDTQGVREVCGSTSVKAVKLLPLGMIGFVLGLVCGFHLIAVFG